MDIKGDMYMTMLQHEFAALPENQRVALELIYFGRPWIAKPLDKERAKQAKITLKKKLGTDKWRLAKDIHESLGDEVASQFLFVYLTGANPGVVATNGLPDDLIV